MRTVPGSGGAVGKAAKRRRQQERREAREQRQQQVRRRSFNWKPFLGWGIAAVLVGGLGLVLLTSSGSSEVSDELAVAAAESSRGEVRVIRGSQHTVYHSEDPLPTRRVPQADGAPTLVWFSGTWCEFCERMDPFIHGVGTAFDDRMVFVEKSIDHDRSAASSYGVRGTPTFVMLDAEGNEQSRFHFQRNAEDLRQAIETALTTVNG